MEKDSPKVSVHLLAKIFKKIGAALPKEQTDVLVGREMSQMLPSEDSEVLIMSGYSEDDNSISLNIHMSNPRPAEPSEELDFGRLMFDYLIRTDVEKLPKVAVCLRHMESRGGEEYEMDGIPVFYTKQLGTYDIHLRITKKLKK